MDCSLFRSPVEISAVSVHTMLPYHTATASALLTSMLSVAPRSYGWTLEGILSSIVVDSICISMNSPSYDSYFSVFNI